MDSFTDVGSTKVNKHFNYPRYHFLRYHVTLQALQRETQLALRRPEPLHQRRSKVKGNTNRVYQHPS
ncbi:unnamed protein product [Caretta caretta]